MHELILKPWQNGNGTAGGDDDDDDEDTEGGFQKWQVGNRDGMIFLVDCSKSMFEQDGDDSSFDLAIKCAKSVIQNKIISSEKDLLGIVFFGTEKQKNGTQSEHIYVAHELHQPGADTVLALEALLDEPNNDGFTNKYGHNKGYSIGEAFWTCSDMFAKCPHKLAFRRILLFTNNDNPHRDDAALKRAAATKAEDLHNNGIKVELFHMNRAGKQFDINAFYKDTLVTDDDDSAITPDPSEKFEELLARLRIKDYKKRALTRIPLSLGEGMDFSVGVYSLIRSCHAPYGVKLFKKTNEEVKTVTKTFLEATGEILMPQDMKKTQTYAGKKILFEKEEVDEMKRFHTAGLKVMGFKPRSSLKKYFHVRPAQFIYPDESTIEGSTKVFTAMLSKCLEKDVVAICRYIPRKNSAPRFVALVPQAEELDGHKNQLTPAGFSVIFMPYADDIRKVTFDKDLPRANSEQVNKAKEIIKKLQFKFRSDNFENPKLQTHYVNVEAMALDRDTPEDVEDYTLPNIEMMDKRAGRLISEFKDLAYPEDYDPNSTTRKRVGTGTTSASAPKRAKVDVTDVNIEAEAKAGRLNKLTVPVLRDVVRSLKLRPDSSKKADLIGAINDHFGV